MDRRKLGVIPAVARRFFLTIMWSAAVPSLALAGQALAQNFDGITIIDFADPAGAEAIAHGSHIITFVSARGSYAAVATNAKGTRRGCIATGVLDSYTGAAIAFGADADLPSRTQGLRTLCPRFVLRYEGPGVVRVTAGPNFSRRHRVVARIPLRPVDFGAASVTRHDIKGVRLGPVANGAELGPLRATGGSGDRFKNFQHQAGKNGRRDRSMVYGHAAAAEITGWPWDVLYEAQYIREFGERTATSAFWEAVRLRYGAPSATRARHYMLWLYDLDGKLVVPEQSPENSCLVTADFRLQRDEANAIAGIDWNADNNDFGPWGCSTIMELSANSASGGVDGYFIRIASGYAMAVNHFIQRIEETTRVAEKVGAPVYKPHL